MVDRHRVHAEFGSKPPHGQGVHALFVHQSQRSVEDTPARQRLLPGPRTPAPIAAASSLSSQKAPPPCLIIHRMVIFLCYTLYGLLERLEEVRWSDRWRTRLRWWPGNPGRGAWDLRGARGRWCDCLRYGK